MGAVQKLATVVIVGMVGLATLLVVYLANEPNRRVAEAQEQEHAAVERGIATYIQNCMVCHGPAGEGLFGNDGRPGLPLNPTAGPPKNPSDTEPSWHDNQTDDPTIWAAREEVIYDALNNGRGLMPAWGSGAEGGALLNDEQIYELVEMIHTVDWNLVYNEAIAANHGEYPAAPTQVPSATTTPEAGGGEAAGGGGEAADGGGESVATLIAFDIGWELNGARTPATPIRLEVAAGDTFTVENQGAALHNFVSDQAGIATVEVTAGASAPVTVPADLAPGEYEFICSVPGHAAAGMVGTLVVQ